MKKILTAIALLCMCMQSYAFVQLPLLVVGAAGRKITVKVNIPAGTSAGITHIYARVHNLSYAGKGSVQVNEQPLYLLTNSSVTVLGYGGLHGGIGGDWSTIDIEIPVKAGSFIDGVNTVSFVFNGTDGLSIGYRVLALNVKGAEGKYLLGPSEFRGPPEGDFNPAYTDPVKVAQGEKLWRTASLIRSPLNKSQMADIHCMDCHAQDGSDLKYFRYEPEVILERSVFHGLTREQGRLIQSYIATRPIIGKGRPWNPPYQPGPGMDSKPLEEWSAGAGIDSVLKQDKDILNYLTPDLYPTAATVNLRETPVAFQLLDWNRWLPTVHPKDAFGTRFTDSSFYWRFAGTGAGVLPYGKAIRKALEAPDRLTYIKSRLVLDMADWIYTQRANFINPITTPLDKADAWTVEDSEKVYSVGKWMAVKLWEVTKEFNLESYGPEIVGAKSEKRTTIHGGFEVASPARMGTPLSEQGVRGNIRISEYDTNAWDYVQMVVNSGNRTPIGGYPLDWGYVETHSLHMSRVSVDEFMRFTLILKKAMESRDNGLPMSSDKAWNPRWNAPVALLAMPQFNDYDVAVRRTVIENMLRSWLAKMKQFAAAEYYAAGYASITDVPKKNLGGALVDQIWSMIPEFRKIGVSNTVLDPIVSWSATVWPQLDWKSLSSTGVLDGGGNN